MICFYGIIFAKSLIENQIQLLDFPQFLLNFLLLDTFHQYVEGVVQFAYPSDQVNILLAATDNKDLQIHR